MVFESFTKKPFKDRLKDTGFLIKNSFTIIGKDKDIKTPTIHMIVLSTIITTFIYSAILTFFFVARSNSQTSFRFVTRAILLLSGLGVIK